MSDKPCSAVIIIKGEHYRCNTPFWHDGRKAPHGNTEAQAIWGEADDE